MHQIAITTTFSDGHVSRWTYQQPGTAQDSYAALVKRWKAAGKTFEHDPDLRMIVRRYEAGDERESPVTYTDVIRHEDL